MNALFVFEAAARLSSFTIASKELGVTQAAVSKQIKCLEDTLDVKLFHRLHRSIKMTNEGCALFTVLTDSLQRISGVFDKILDGQGEHEVTLACTGAFSQLRIMPRFPILREAHPSVQIRLVPPMHRDADIVIRFGNGEWADGESNFLFDEEVFPVCSPGWIAANPAPLSIEDLYQSPLVDSDATLEGWMTWNTWFRALGRNPPGLRINLRCTMYGDTIQAALQGQGIALGWKRLTSHLLDAGRLVRLTEFSVKPKDSYYTVIPHGRESGLTGRKVIQWLQDDLPLAHQVVTSD
jgi:DNA-binding transcriptional LysR family regulator